MKIDFNIGACKIIVFTPSDEIAANNPVPITTPNRWGYVPLIPNFTPREASVLQLVAEGLMNKEIARKLETSIRNVEKYVSRLFIKTTTSSRTELVRYALENHLVK